MPYHLKECLLDFGPAASFWLFSFELMNGLPRHFQHYICSDQKLELLIVTQHKCSVVWPDAQLVSRLLRPVLSEVNIGKVIMLSGGLYEHMITSCD